MDSAMASNRLALRLRRKQRCEGMPGALLGSAATPPATGEGVPAEVAEQVARLKDQLARARAEFDNFRKRTRRDAQQQAELANKALIESLLPVLDNFERAMANPGQSVEALLSGIQIVQKQLVDVLGAAGLEKIDPVGKPFDPSLHEAVATGPAGEVPDGHVMEVLQAGYLLKGKLARPAMARVARD
jgi:molecular chaperone GrpE